MGTPIYNFDLKGLVFPLGRHPLKPDFDLKIQPKWDIIQMSKRETSKATYILKYHPLMFFVYLLVRRAINLHYPLYLTNHKYKHVKSMTECKIEKFLPKNGLPSSFRLNWISLFSWPWSLRSLTSHWTTGSRATWKPGISGSWIGFISNSFWTFPNTMARSAFMLFLVSRMGVSHDFYMWKYKLYFNMMINILKGVS